MQDAVKIVEVNQLTPHPVIVKQVADVLERLLRARIASGQYIAAKGRIRKVV